MIRRPTRTTGHVRSSLRQEMHPDGTVPIIWRRRPRPIWPEITTEKKKLAKKNGKKPERSLPAETKRQVQPGNHDGRSCPVRVYNDRIRAKRQKESANDPLAQDIEQHHDDEEKSKPHVW